MTVHPQKKSEILCSLCSSGLALFLRQNSGSNSRWLQHLLRVVQKRRGPYSKCFAAGSTLRFPVAACLLMQIWRGSVHSNQRCKCWLRGTYSEAVQGRFPVADLVCSGTHFEVDFVHRNQSSVQIIYAVINDCCTFRNFSLKLNKISLACWFSPEGFFQGQIWPKYCVLYMFYSLLILS